MSSSEFLHSFLFQPYERQIYPNIKEFYGTHYDAMELLEIGKWKIKTWWLLRKLIFAF